MKTTSLKNFVVIAVLLLSLPVMAKEPIVARVFKTPAFHSVSTSSGWDVILTHGNEFSVRAEAPKKLIDNLLVEIKDNTLCIRNKKQSNFNFGISERNVRKQVHITLPMLKSVSASGGSEVSATTIFRANNIKFTLSGGSEVKNFALQCADFECNASGGSDVEISFSGVNNIATETSGGSDISLKNITAKSVTLSISGGSDVKLTGKTDFLSVSASGGSDVDAKQLMSLVCEGKFSGASDAELWVEKELKVTASGGSDVYYKGNATVQKNNDKSSSVKRI